MFVVTLKGGIPECRWNEFIKYVVIFLNIEITLRNNNVIIRRNS
jgi:hypothetical protein